MVHKHEKKTGVAALQFQWGLYGHDDDEDDGRTSSQPYTDIYISNSVKEPLLCLLLHINATVSEPVISAWSAGKVVTVGKCIVFVICAHMQWLQTVETYF